MPGTLLHAALPAYRRLRRLKNGVLNAVDPPVVVLGYHRVATKQFDPHLLAVSPENFRAQMEYLKRNFRLLRLEEEWSHRDGPGIVVTFDDGYADNLLEALPVLEENGIPATFFISTFLLEPSDQGKVYWWDELERLVLGGKGCREPFRLEGVQSTRLWPTAALNDRRALHDALHRLFLGSPLSRRADLLQALQVWGGPGAPVQAKDRLLTREEVRQLAANPCSTIGAHTVTHAALASLSEAEQREEIAGSKQQLEELLGREVTVFAYPFGSRSEFDSISVRVCRESGFQKAVSTLPGQAHRWTDPLQIPRQLVRNWDVETFAARLESFWS